MTPLTHGLAFHVRYPIISLRGSNSFLSSSATSLHHIHSNIPIPSQTCAKRHRSTLSMSWKGQNNERMLTLAQGRGVDKTIASRVLETAERVVREWSMCITEFLTPPESAAMSFVLSNMPDLHVIPWGGYADAERTVLALSHAEVCENREDLPMLVADQLALLKVSGDFEKQNASHRDFMGAILNAGISRSKVGDIIVLDTRGAQAVVSADIVNFLSSSITTVRQTNVKTERLDLANIEVPERRVKEIESVESSLRLDAVVSGGLKVSRSKLADMARSGLVQINYKEVKMPAKNVKTGDIVSVRGIGKLEIGEYKVTSKGRYRVEMKKYI